MRRPHLESKAPLAIGGILALPLFFVGLMAFSLKLDKPSHHAGTTTALRLGDPTKGTLGTIYLLALAVAGGIVLVGALASVPRWPLTAVIPAVGGIVASVLLLLPLDTWAAAHTARYPLGVDNIAKSSPYDKFLRGEWEGNARTTAHQIGLVTIGIAIAAILVSLALELRRRRGIESPAVPPPPETVGAPEMTGS